MNARSGEGAASEGTHDSSHAIRLGIALWIVFAVVAVAVRGVRWDEAYEHAQILSGQVPYPESHPLYRYVHNGFSLQTYLAAAVVAVVPNPLVLCGIRNVLFVLAGVLPVYLFTARLTGDAVWAHVAALLTLNGTFLEFDSSYPLSVWPNTFTNGYLGGGYMLLTLYMVIAGRLRVGLFLLGLAPAIHIGQLPGIAGACGLFLIWQLMRGDRGSVIRAIPWGLAGLAVCATFAVVVRAFHVPAATPPPDPDVVRSVWQGYTAYFDPHRQFPPVNAQIGAVLTLFLGAGVARARGTTEPLWTWLFITSAIIAAIVWGTMAAHAVMGREIPFLLIGWMPYRLLNLLLPVLLVTVVGVLARGPARWLLFGALAFGIGLPALAWMGGAAVERYFASGEFVLFVFCGAAVIQTAHELWAERRVQIAWLGLAASGLVALVFVHQWGAICLALGAVLGILARPSQPVFARRSTAVAAALLALVLLIGEGRSREQLPRTAMDARIAEYLAEAGEPEAMLLAHPYEFLLQARTGHSVLVETATASLMSYLPELGPGIQQTYGDLYSIRFDVPPTDAEEWKTLWQQRSKQDWNALSSRYGIDFIIAPATVELDLDAVVEGESMTLYQARGGD